MIVHETQRFIARYHARSIDEATTAETIDVTAEQLSSPLSLSPGSFVLPPAASVVLTGDLNDVPDSPMYRFLCSGASTEDASSRGRTSLLQWGIQTAVQATAPLRSFVWLRTPEVVQRAWNSTGGRAVALATAASPPVDPVTHELWLHSLYNRCFSPRASAAAGHHPGSVYTIAQRRLVLSQGCIDYIFYTPASLIPRALLSLPDVAKELPEYLPCVRYPSDHLAIAGRFEWR